MKNMMKFWIKKSLAMAALWSAASMAGTVGAQSVSVVPEPLTPTGQDSVVQVTADARGLTRLEALPATPGSVYWVAAGGNTLLPYPTVPPAASGLTIAAAYEILPGSFLLDASGGQGDPSVLLRQADAVDALINQVQTASLLQATALSAPVMQAQTLGVGAPMPGGGSGTSGGGVIAKNLPPLTGARLAITNVSRSTVSFNLVECDASVSYTVYYSGSLNPPVTWTPVATVPAGQMWCVVPNTFSNTAFFRLGWLNGPATVATPAFTPAGGFYGSPVNVTINSATTGALIYYTTNSNVPTMLDNYIANGSSLKVASITTLKAKAFLYGYADSGVATASYTINAAPVVSAGEQQIISSFSTTLAGWVTDDGLTGGGIKFTNWSVVSAPSTVTFSNAAKTNTTVTFGDNGIYVLQLSACDGQYTNAAQVTIAVNPTIAVSVTAPADGSSYTVPTNILLQATASGVTRVLFYANDALIGEATGSPLSLNWQSVPAGTIKLTAVGVSEEPTITNRLASAPVTLTVNWPTNTGQVTCSVTDLQIPVAGLPIAVNRQYDTRSGAAQSFGYNGSLDYEQIKIEKNMPLATGWTGRRTGSINYWVEDTSKHVITVSLSGGEKYYFQPRPQFRQSNYTYADSLASMVIPRYVQGYRGQVAFLLMGGSQGTLEISPTPADMGYNDANNINDWVNAAIILVQGGSTRKYEPGFSQYVFTAPNGTKYCFYDDGTVASQSDRNGNTLYYSSGGIAHSSGKQITFTRDGNNYITEVYDPIALATSGAPALKYTYDGNGNLTNVARLIQRSPAIYETTAYSYTNKAFPHNITAITDPRGVVSARYEYNAAGQLTAQYDALNNVTRYYYDNVTHKRMTTDRNGNTTVETFTDAGQIGSVRDGSGGVTTYVYNGQGQKIADINPVGDTNAYTYDSNNNLNGITDGNGNSRSATFNDFGQPLETTDALGNGTTNTYDGNGNLISVANALGIVNGYVYDYQGNQIEATSAMGLPEQATVANAYDEYGNLTNTATLDANQNPLNQTSYTYDANGNKLTETKRRTLPTSATQFLTNQWVYDAANRVIATVDAAGNTNLTSYNGIGKQAQTADALGRKTQFFYDANGLLTNTIYPDGSRESSTYEPEGRRLTSTDRAGRVTTYQYDATGRPLRTMLPDGSYTASGYDAAGQMTRSIQGSASGMEQVVTYAYDANGRRSGQTNALGQTTRFAYNANGSQTNVTDALGHKTAQTFDALNRLVQTTYPDGSSERYGYDGQNRKVAVTNQAGLVTAFGYDALGQLVAVTNAVGAAEQMVTRYIYDEVGNLTQQIDALNRTNKFEYDVLGRKTKETLPNLQAQSFVYDAAGNLIRQTTFNGNTLTNQYDVLNRLTNQVSAGYQVTYTYSATGQRTGMTDASGATSYTYDSRDRLLTKTTPQGKLTYTYDGFGNLASVESATVNGTKLTYGYDALNRLTSVADRFGNAAAYGFDAVGNLQTVRLPNNVTNTYTYDSLNRLTNLVAKTGSGTLASFTYKLAPVGNRTNLVETVNGVNRTNTWAYDRLYRLTNETIIAASGGTVSYKYDAVGNRLSRASTVAGVAAASSAFNNNDQLTTDTYDSNGSTTASGGNTYAYDVLGRLTNYNNGAATFVYDGDGNRVRKTVGGVTTSYLVDDRNPSGYAQVLEEITPTATTLFTYGLDLISQRQANGTMSFYGYDGNGNARYLTAANATISDTYAYDAFGVQLTSTGTTPNNYKYAGEQYDPNLGFYYLRSRYVNPNTGRFWTRDTFAGSNEDPLSLHRYTYTANNPLNAVDPSGHMALDAMYMPVITIAFQRALITLATATAAKYAWDTVEPSIEEMIQMAQSAIKAKGKTLAGLIATATAIAGLSADSPIKVIPVPAEIIGQVAAHVERAQTQKGKPKLLTRCDAVQAIKNRRFALKDIPLAVAGYSRDEYPFASSNESTRDPEPSVEPVPILENFIQGGIIGACYVMEKIAVDTQYQVVVIP